MEILQSNREKNNLLRKDLEDKDELVSFVQVFGLVSLKQFGADVSGPPLQMLELQSTCAEKEQLLSERTRQLQEKTSEVKAAEENVSALTQEKEKLRQVLQGVREERDQLKREQLEKSETVSEVYAHSDDGLKL